jgi:HD domain
VLLTELPALDALLRAHAAALGPDFTAYANHTWRVANFCAALASPDAEALEKIAIAAALHDLGIWTAGTFDYLPPSIALASEHLARSGRAHWGPEIGAMIREHHKVSAYRTEPGWLVEPFRRADWVDISRGALRFGLDRRRVREVFAVWPDAGFHWRLVQLTARRARTHPLSPLPMLRL